MCVTFLRPCVSPGPGRKGGGASKGDRLFFNERDAQISIETPIRLPSEDTSPPPPSRKFVPSGTNVQKPISPSQREIQQTTARLRSGRVPFVKLPPFLFWGIRNGHGGFQIERKSGTLSFITTVHFNILLAGGADVKALHATGQFINKKPNHSG